MMSDVLYCKECDKLINMRSFEKNKWNWKIIIEGNRMKGGSGKMKLIRIILNIDNISISRDLYIISALTTTL